MGRKFDVCPILGRAAHAERRVRRQAVIVVNPVPELSEHTLGAPMFLGLAVLEEAHERPYSPWRRAQSALRKSRVWARRHRSLSRRMWFVGRLSSRALPWTMSPAA